MRAFVAVLAVAVSTVLPGHNALTERDAAGPGLAPPAGSQAPASRSVSALSTIRLTLAFACIHRYEGAWDAATGNGYYGGLQMDPTFERMYGPAYLRRLGHADRWPAAVQVQVAIRAFRSGRGFGPWPNTRKLCGL